jgi:hypothetical protein
MFRRFVSTGPKLFRWAALSVTVLVAAVAAPQRADAASIFITDCQGFTRAVKAVEPGVLNSVQIAVTAAGKPASGVPITLTNTVSGAVTTVEATDGIATFPGVTSGVFSISTPESGIQIGAITIESGSISPGAAGVIGGAIVAGGIAGAGVGIAAVADDGGSDSPTPTPLPTSIPAPTVRPTPTRIPTPLPTATEICDPDAMPTPIETFFPDGVVPNGTPVSGFR